MRAGSVAESTQDQVAVPLLVFTDELQPGMMMHDPVVSNGRVMLQAGRMLTAADILVIRRRYPGMRVRVHDPVLDSVVEFEDDARERRVADETQQRVARCLTEVRERFANRTAVSQVDCGLLQATVRELMEFLKANPTSAAVVASCLDSRNYLGVHAGNVFYLSMLLAAASMDYLISERLRQMRARDVAPTFAGDLAPLGLAAMVMDLGMQPLQHLTELERPLTDAEREAIRRHPLDGFNLLPDGFSAVARAVVKTHHENMKGTGYPQQLPGDRLHIFSRIVRIADAFDAATSDRVFRAAKSPARVLWEMTIGPMRHFYDAKLAQVFAGLVQPFPIGSKLRLRDGRYAPVVKYNREDPFDPYVIIAFDASNRRLSRAELEGPLRLSSRPDLRLASLAGEDLSYLHSREPVDGDEFEAHRFRTPLQAAYP